MPTGAPRTFIRWWAIVLAVVLVAGACGDDDDSAATDATPPADASPSPDEDATPPGQTPTPAPTAIDATPAPTATAAPTSDGNGPPPPSGCDVALPGGRSEESTASADVDGDGAPDTVRVFALGPVDDPASWQLHVELAAGGGIASPVDPDVPIVAPSQALGGFDVQGDGRDEVFVTVGSGAAARIVALWATEGCNLTRVTYDGAPASFPVGATVGSASGVECRDIDANGANDAIVRWTGFSTDGLVYEMTGEVLTLSGHELSFLQADARTVDLGEPGAESVASLACGDLTLP